MKLCRKSIISSLKQKIQWILYFYYSEVKKLIFLSSHKIKSAQPKPRTKNALLRLLRNKLNAITKVCV